MKKRVLCTFLMVGSFGCINSWSYQPTQQEKENLLATVARSSDIKELKKIISDNTVSLTADISELKQLFINSNKPWHENYLSFYNGIAHYVTYTKTIACALCLTAYAGILYKVAAAHRLLHNKERWFRYQLPGLYDSDNDEVAQMLMHEIQLRTTEPDMDIALQNFLQDINSEISALQHYRRWGSISMIKTLFFLDSEIIGTAQEKIECLRRYKNIIINTVLKS